MQFNDKYEELGDIAMSVLNENNTVLNETRDDLDEFKRKLTEIGISVSRAAKYCSEILYNRVDKIADLIANIYGKDPRVYEDYPLDDVLQEAGGERAYTLYRATYELAYNLEQGIKAFEDEFNKKVTLRMGDDKLPPDPMDREDRLFKKEPPPPKPIEPVPPNAKQQTIPGMESE